MLPPRKPGRRGPARTLVALATAATVAATVASLAAVVACTSGAPGGGDPAPLVVVSWDGAGDAIVDRLLAEGRLPHLAALIARGVAAEHSVTSYPSKTAPGHAEVYTGAPPAVHGVTANEVPLLPPGAHTLLDRRRGFHSAQLAAEPLYVTTARAGRRTVVLSATQSYPPAPHLAALGAAAAHYRSLSVFENRLARRRLWTAADATAPGDGWGLPAARLAAAREVAFEAGGCGAECRFYALALGDAEGRVLVRRGSRAAAATEVVLRPGDPAALDLPAARAFDPAAWSPPLRIRDGALAGNLFLRLFTPRPGEGFALYQRAVHAPDGACPPAEVDALLAACPGFHDDAFGDYARGLFGPPLPAGGDGVAELRLLELAAFDLAASACASRFAAARWAPQALFEYTPWSDSAGHAWWGLFDPAAEGHDAELAARTWPYYARVFALQDAWLGDLVAALPGAVVALVSDHGMAAVRRHLHVEQALAEAGLLAWDADGGVDLARTRAAAPFPEFGVRVNGVEWRQGIVPAAQREATIDAVEAALLAVVDPATGERPVARVFRGAALAALGLPPPPRGADLHYDLAPGWHAVSGPAAAVTGPARWRGEAQHGFPPRRRDMHAIFYAAGPGLRRGARIGVVRHRDVAPTLAAAIGIPAPAQATGRVVAEAIAGAPDR